MLIRYSSFNCFSCLLVVLHLTYLTKNVDIELMTRFLNKIHHLAQVQAKGGTNNLYIFKLLMAPPFLMS
jgi:hypothetical protein